MKLSDVRELYNVDAYRDALQIDQYRLDDMLMQQPFIQQTISELHAEVASMRDAAKERLSRVDAQAAKVLRNRLMIEEGKVSEARIDREVPLTKEHKEAHHVYNELCALAAQWEALKDTSRNRAFVIRDLVSLYTANFFTDTSFRSQTNPNSVKELEHQQARAALAEGRRARRTLAGVPHDVELRAGVDEAVGEDADLGEIQSTSRISDAHRRSVRSTARGGVKKSVAQMVDTGKGSDDTASVSEKSDKNCDKAETSSKDASAKSEMASGGGSFRAAIRDRVRNRSARRVAEAEDADETTGARTLTEVLTAEPADVELDPAPAAEETTDASVVDAEVESGESAERPRRRRRHARSRAVS